MGNIKNVKEIGEFQTYDLEVDHPDHQFYLSNGILTSNSHSILYSMTSYKTAFLKSHFPIEFLMANLMAEVKSNAPTAKSNIDKIKKELRKHVEIIRPDLNKSQLVYALENDNKLLTGLDAIKFVSDSAIQDIVAKRPFKDFFDFMVRVSSKLVRANTIQALAATGALDSFNIPRKLIFLYCSDYRKKLQTWLKRHDPNKETFSYPWPKEDNWTKPEIYALEHFYLGESFSCKPVDAYGTFLKGESVLVAQIKKAKDKVPIHAFKGIVRDFFEFRIKKEGKYYGQPMVKALLEDRTGDQIGITIFPDKWKMVQERIQRISKKTKFEAGLAMYISGITNNYEDEMGIILDNIYDIAPSPTVPTDLKAKKVNLKEARIKASEPMEEADKKQSLFERIEDILYDEGLVDLDEELDVD
jgi:DNA polymerase III alpha subunit